MYHDFRHTYVSASNVHIHTFIRGKKKKKKSQCKSAAAIWLVRAHIVRSSDRDSNKKMCPLEEKEKKNEQEVPVTLYRAKCHNAAVRMQWK